MRHDACALDDIAPDGMNEVELGGMKVLLVRDGEAVHAVSAVCPHQGGPLKDGTRVGNRIICPWHHAMFDLRSGEHLEPPGKGCLTRFETEIAQGRVFVEVAEGADAKRPEVEPDARRTGGTDVFALVGAGAAGLACAQELVKQGFDGRIVMISPEAEPPYDRTALSKTYLAGKMPDEKLPLESDGTLDALGIERHVGEVVAIDRASREIRFADGEVLAFAKAFVAPGSAAVAPDLDGADRANVVRLRSHDDAKALKAQVGDADRIVIVGAGFIALEAAAALVGLKKTVTVISREALPFAEKFGEAVAGQIVAQHRGKGVTVLTETSVASLRTRGETVDAVLLDDGRALDADLVILAIGAAPRIALLDPQAENGISVDGRLAVCEAIFAGGDIASFRLPGRDEPVRIEHWRVAEQHGRHAARAMLGRAQAYDGVPFFWSAQYGAIHYVGHAAGFDEVHVEGDLASGSYTAFYIKDGRVRAALGRGKADTTADLHAVMLTDPLPAREALDKAGWQPKALISRDT